MSLASGVTALASRIAQEVNALRGETSSGLAGKAALSHTHVEGDVTSLTTDLAGKAAASHTHAESDVTSLTTDLAGKAATVHTHAAADVTSGTLTIARIPTGTTSSTVALGNDARLSDQRTPTDSSVTNAKVSATAAIAESKLSLASDAVAGTASRRSLGTGAQQACAGNDSRLSDTRTPTDGSVTDAKVATTAAIAESKLALASDAAAGVASRRTLGTGATQAAPGNHAHAGTMIARGRRTTHTLPVISAATNPDPVNNPRGTQPAFTASRVLMTTATLTSGHLYQVQCFSAGVVGPPMGATNPSGTTVNLTIPCFVAQLVYTVDGTDPQTNSTVLGQCSGPTVDGITIWNPLSGFYVATGNVTFKVTLQFLGTVQKDPGYYVYADATFPTDIVISDLGTNTGTTQTVY